MRVIYVIYKMCLVTTPIILSGVSKLFKKRKISEKEKKEKEMYDKANREAIKKYYS